MKGKFIIFSFLISIQAMSQEMSLEKFLQAVDICNNNDRANFFAANGYKAIISNSEISYWHSGVVNCEKQNKAFKKEIITFPDCSDGYQAITYEIREKSLADKFASEIESKMVFLGYLKQNGHVFYDTKSYKLNGKYIFLTTYDHPYDCERQNYFGIMMHISKHDFNH